MPLMVHSDSTEKFARGITGNFFKVTGPPTRKTFDIETQEEIVAIGGGSVIDTAKIMAIKSNGKRVIAMPTTASGASETSHAVYWHNHRKFSVDTPRPISNINPDFLTTLPQNVIKATSYDALSQALESYWSKNATLVSKFFALNAIKIVTHQIKAGYPDLEKLIEGGILSGKAIEMTGTNIVHAISYPLTGFYGIPHGLAVGLILPAVARFVRCKIKIPKYKIIARKTIDINLVANEAMSYSQIHDAIKDITKEQVIKILRESL